MGRAENVEIFQDTEKLCKTNEKLAEALKKSIASQKIILESDELGTTSLDRLRYDNEPAKRIVSAKRTFEAALGYEDTKIAVLNFASASNPGGGVVRGANAQEECLCRCSDLYFCLNTKENWDGFYAPHRLAKNPLHNDDIIYTPNVTVFKSDTANPRLLPENEWYNVDVITCAAPNLRENPSNIYNTSDGDTSVKITEAKLQALHEKRLRRILDVAVANGIETIILGAFGCGAFLNDPNVVALASQNVLKEYTHAFRNIEFAVYCSPRDDSNFRTFRKILIEDRRYHEINDSVKINFKVPKTLQQMMDCAEDADLNDNLGLYMNFADTIDVMAKNIYAAGRFTESEWNTLTMRYRQG